MKRAIEQIIGREGETASLYECLSLNFMLRVAGFAPRQFNRSAFRGDSEICSLITLELRLALFFKHKQNLGRGF